MDTSTLLLFRDLCRTRNMTQTARAFFLTQSTLSKRLAQLEEELGYPLLVRSKGRQQAELTSRGEKFLVLATRMLELYEESRALKEEQERFFLRLGCMRSVQEAFLSDFLERFLVTHPRFSLTLEDHHSHEIRELLLEGLLDLGVVQVPYTGHGLVSQLLYDEYFQVVMKDPGRFRGKKALSVRELDARQEIFQSFTDGFRAWHDTHWRILDSKIRVNSTPTAEKYFQAPEDWMIVPCSVARAMTVRGFTAFPLKEVTPLHQVYLCWRQGEDLPHVMALLDALEEHFNP